MKHGIVGTCYVCRRDVHAVTVREQLEKRRAMNTPVWILSPGVQKKYPHGIVRHSYCAPGTDRWARHLGTGKRDSWWGRIFGFTRKGGRWVREEAQP